MVKKKSTNSFIQFIGLGFQIIATIFLFHWIGKKLDGKFPNSGQWYSKLSIILGVVFSVVGIVIQTNKMNKP